MKEIPGVPINPHRHADKTLWQEFWTDFLAIFCGVDDIPGAVFSVFLAIGFVIKWPLVLIGRKIK